MPQLFLIYSSHTHTYMKLVFSFIYIREQVRICHVVQFCHLLTQRCIGASSCTPFLPAHVPWSQICT